MKKNYFYAEDEPALYDRTVSLTERSYEMGHDALQEVFKAWSRACDLVSAPLPLLLDLGCGTGKECLPFLSFLPKMRLIAVDNSEPMLQVFESKIELARGATARDSGVTLIHADFSIDGWELACVDAARDLGAAPGSGSFDLIVAAHSLHHLSHEEKRRLYDRCCSLLKPGGLFLILDLFDYLDPLLSRLAKDNMKEWMLRQMSPQSIVADHAGLFPLDRREHLAQMWSNHIETENHPLALDDLSRDRATAAYNEIAALCAAGFGQIEVPFRWFQSGLIVARRGEDEEQS